VIAGLASTLATSAAAASPPHVRAAASPATSTSGTAPLWANRFKGTRGDTAGYADAVSPDGSTVYVTGSARVSKSHPHTSGVTVAYDSATGAALWQTRYNAINRRNLAVSPDGSTVFLTGSATSSPGYFHFLTAALDATTGAQLWAASFRKGFHVGEGSAVAVSPDGSTVFVTGYTFGPTAYRGWGTVAYDATTGAQLWVVHFIHRTQDIEGTSITASPDGSKVFTTGAIWSSTDGNPDTMVTAAYNS
jgi:putative pyrroloquinoline-quinone binding quinoprotein